MTMTVPPFKHDYFYMEYKNDYIMFCFFNDLFRFQQTVVQAATKGSKIRKPEGKLIKSY